MHLFILGAGLIILPALLVSIDHETRSVENTLSIPCTYSVSDGTTTVCWGRGHCPSYKCNDEISWTDGTRVTWRKSERYQLLGNIAEGDVSLTITGVTMDDAGVYCCRVEIPGWFNDLKREIYVKIQEDIEHFDYDDDDIIIEPKVAQVHAPDRSSQQLAPTYLDQQLVPTHLDQQLAPTHLSSKAMHTVKKEPSKAEKTSSIPEVDVEVTEETLEPKSQKIPVPVMIRAAIIFSLTLLPLIIWSWVKKQKRENES
ncbi:hepatitis A virus cellular receptor 1 homolog [Mixophyes fleayi]|uniref:hepatitis A virus cellular receptor 1 homolog n=1 Tax=Mixophyes fleayi TaxID=3061075 RepID=UPI003F4E013B